MSFDPSVEVTGSFVIDNPNYVYGLQRVPNKMRYEEMDAVWWSSAFASQGVVIEPNTRVMILQPVPLQVPTRLADWQFNSTGAGAADTSAKWREVLEPTSGLTVIEQPDATADRSFYATSKFDLDPNACFYVNLYRSEASRDATRSPLDFYTQVVMGDGMPGALRLSLGYNAPPVLEVAVAIDAHGAAAWEEVCRSPEIPDAQAYIAGLADGVLRLRVLTLACEGAIVLDIGLGDAALVFRMDGVTLPPGPLTVVGKNGVSRVQYQPMRFVPVGAAVSALRDMGRLMSDPQTAFDAAQSATATVSVEAQTVGTQSQYALTLDASASADASGFATQTPVVRSVSVLYPGVAYNDVVPGTRQMNVKRVEGENLVFDMASLSFSQEATVVCDNHAGQWAGASGFRAGYLAAGFNGDNWPRIAGWVTAIQHTRDDPVRETRFSLVGKEYWLKRRKVGVIGPLDGWDVYAAARSLAQLGGVTDYWLQALPYTPPGRGAPSPYYHLPVGTGLQGALFQFDPRTSVWDALQQLARKVRGYIGFDCYGFLQFYRWSMQNLGAYMQAFSTVPMDFDGEPLYNQLKGSFSSRVDLADVRSDITLGAIDPFTFQPVFAHAHNESVVTDISSPAFLGNEDTEIEINSLLFDPATQDATLDALSYQASLPSLTTYLDGWYQYRLYPLDVISVAEGYCLGGVYPFYVTEMRSNYGVNEQGGFGATQLAGRWLYNA